jgi:hypothetical protein
MDSYSSHSFKNVLKFVFDFDMMALLVAYCLAQRFVVRICGFYKLMCLYIFIYLFYIICSVHLFRSFVKNWKVFYKC